MIVDTDEKIIGRFQDHYNALVQGVKNRLQFEITQYANISYTILKETVFYVYEKDKEGHLIEPSNVVPLKVSFTPQQTEDLKQLQVCYCSEEEIDNKFTEIGEYCVNRLIKILQEVSLYNRYSFFDIIADENKALFAITQQVYQKTLASDLTQLAVCC